MASISAVASALVQPVPVHGRPDPVPPPPPEPSRNQHEALFRRAVAKAEPAEEPARRPRDKIRQTAGRRRADRAEAPERRARGTSRGQAVQVTLFPGFEGFTPQFLTQFIAQALMPDQSEAAEAQAGVGLYGKTESRATGDVFFGPVRPFAVIA